MDKLGKRGASLLCSLFKQGTASSVTFQLSRVVEEQTLKVPRAGFIIQQRCYAARKGTRAKKEKNKVKKEIVVEEFIPYKLKQELGNKPKASRRANDDSKPSPVDDVYLMICHKTRILTVPEAIEAHREVHHPTMYNKPDAMLMATIELDLRTDKKTKFVGNLNRVAEIPYPHTKDEMKNVLAFVKTPELQQAALEAGATKVGGPELIKSIQTGDVRTAEYRYIVAHEDISEEVTALRGLLKTKLPTIKAGSIGSDIESLVRRFINGLEYSSKSDVHEKDFGWVDVTLGPLSTPLEHLEGNLAAILKDLHSARSRKSYPFVTRCSLWTVSSKEKFVVEYKQYTGQNDLSGKQPKFVPQEEPSEEDEQELEFVDVNK